MHKQYSQDQSFDRIAEKFEKNIYGTTKGRLRHELLEHYLLQHLSATPMRVLDAGGGTGVMSKTLAALGHQVLLNDVSEDALSIARQKLADFSQVSYHCGPLQSLAEQEPFDLILCHAVLEWLSQPLDAIDGLLTKLAPGGKLSLSFFNRDAHLFSNIIYGNFDYIDKDFVVPNRVRLNPNKAVCPAEVLHFLEAAGMQVVHKAGIRCFHDYVRDKSIQTTHYEQLKAKELEYGTSHPYVWLGRYFHLIAIKPGG